MRFIPEQSYYFHFPSFNRSPKQVVNLRLCRVSTLRRAQIARGRNFLRRQITNDASKPNTHLLRKLLFKKVDFQPSLDHTKIFSSKVFFLFFPFFSFNEKKAEAVTLWRHESRRVNVYQTDFKSNETSHAMGQMRVRI